MAKKDNFNGDKIYCIISWTGHSQEDKTVVADKYLPQAMSGEMCLYKGKNKGILWGNETVLYPVGSRDYSNLRRLNFIDLDTKKSKFYCILKQNAEIISHVNRKGNFC